VRDGIGAAGYVEKQRQNYNPEAVAQAGALPDGESIRVGAAVLQDAYHGLADADADAGVGFATMPAVRTSIKPSSWFRWMSLKIPFKRSASASMRALS
jgi:hypothetical protein